MIGKDGQVVLSKRLQMLADMVSAGNRLADVGCDHGFLSIHLVQRGICPVALAMDVRKGPLAAADAHVRECNLTDYIETRLSDGLLAYNAGEADTMVCAGMGGPLMARILMDSFEKVKQLKELILQPQSEIAEFRKFLRERGFVILDENAVLDEGKYYFAMKAVWPRESRQENEMEAEPNGAVCLESVCRTFVPGDEKLRQQDLYDAYGEHLLRRKHPVLQEFLKQRQEHLIGLRGQLTEANSDKAKLKLPEIDTELAEIAQALQCFA